MICVQRIANFVGKKKGENAVYQHSKQYLQEASSTGTFMF